MGGEAIFTNERAGALLQCNDYDVFHVWTVWHTPVSGVVMLRS